MIHRYYRLDDLDRALAARHGNDDSNSHLDASTSDRSHDRPGDWPNQESGVRSRNEATLLLAHSPEIADAAAAAGCGAYLCGHTHGGQVCLPAGLFGRSSPALPLMRNARAPAERLSGAWRAGAMSGYTSRGAGVSIAEIRFHCPPEITLHVLGDSRRRDTPP